MFKSNWKVQINILCFGQAIVMIMLAMSLPYWPLYVAKLGDFSPSQIRYWSAAIYIAPYISSILISPLWGMIGDHYGYKTMLLRACAGLCLTQGLLLCVSNVFWIVVIRFVQGAISGFIAAAQAWALDIGDTQSKGTIIGKLQASTAIGNLLGPFLGGVIAIFLGYRAIFGVSAFLCCVIAVAFYFVLQSSNKSDAHRIPQAKDIQQQKKYFFPMQTNILFLLLAIVFTQTAQSMVTPVFTLFVTEKLAGNEIIVGLLHSISGLMIFVSAPAFGRVFDRIKHKNTQIPNILILLLSAAGVLQIIHAYCNSLAVLFVIRFLWGICLGGLLPVLIRLLIENTQNMQKGIILGFGNSANRLGTLIGILLGALLELRFGYTQSFLINGAIYFISAIFILMQIHISQKTTQERLSFED